MSEESSPEPEEKDSPNYGRKNSYLWLLWIGIGLAPIPFGLLIGPLNIFNAFQGRVAPLGRFFGIVTVVCAVICGIGQAGGFRTGNASHILVGIIFGGLFMAVFDLGVILCAGCCSGFSH